MSAMRGPCPPRNQHHAAMGGLVLVLLALPGSHKQRGPLVQASGEAVDERRSLRGWRRARRAASALRQILAQGALRSGPRQHKGAVQKAKASRHGVGLLVPG